MILRAKLVICAKVVEPNPLRGIICAMRQRPVGNEGWRDHAQDLPRNATEEFGKAVTEEGWDFPEPPGNGYGMENEDDDGPVEGCRVTEGRDDVVWGSQGRHQENARRVITEEFWGVEGVNMTVCQ